jgi:hypothetical protein
MSLTLTNINISFIANHLSAILCLKNWHDRYAVYDYLPNLSAGSLMFVTLALPPYISGQLHRAYAVRYCKMAMTFFTHFDTIETDRAL